VSGSRPWANSTSRSRPAALQPGQRRPRHDWHLPTEPSPPSPTAAATSDAPDPVAGARGYGPAPVAELSPRPVTDTGTSVLASSLSSDSAEEAPAAAEQTDSAQVDPDAYDEHERLRLGRKLTGAAERLGADNLALPVELTERLGD